VQAPAAPAKKATPAKKTPAKTTPSAYELKPAVPSLKRITFQADSPAPAAKAAAKPAAKKMTPEEEQKAGEEAMLKEANLLHARLVKGEDPDKIQKEAFAAGGLPGTAPPTKMEKVRRTSLPVSHQSVMDLKPGEVSDVISDPSGNYIYKMVSKETLPLDTVKNEIKGQLSSQRYRDAMQHFQNNAEMNEGYFGAVRGPGMPMPPRGNRPPVQPRDNDPD